MTAKMMIRTRATGVRSGRSSVSKTTWPAGRPGGPRNGPPRPAMERSCDSRAASARRENRPRIGVPAAPGGGVSRPASQRSARSTTSATAKAPTKSQASVPMRVQKTDSKPTLRYHIASVTRSMPGPMKSRMANTAAIARVQMTIRRTDGGPASVRRRVRGRRGGRPPMLVGRPASGRSSGGTSVPSSVASRVRSSAGPPSPASPAPESSSESSPSSSPSSGAGRFGAFGSRPSSSACLRRSSSMNSSNRSRIEGSLASAASEPSVSAWQGPRQPSGTHRGPHPRARSRASSRPAAART